MDSEAPRVLFWLNCTLAARRVMSPKSLDNSRLNSWPDTTDTACATSCNLASLGLAFTTISPKFLFLTSSFGSSISSACATASALAAGSAPTAAGATAEPLASNSCSRFLAAASASRNARFSSSKALTDSDDSVLATFLAFLAGAACTSAANNETPASVKATQADNFLGILIVCGTRSKLMATSGAPNN